MAVGLRQVGVALAVSSCLFGTACSGSGSRASASIATATPSTSHSPTLTPSASPSAAASQSSPTASATPVATHSATASATAAASATPATRSATATPSRTPTPNPTSTPLTGPVVTAFGIADASGVPLLPAGTSGGLTVYRTQFGAGFIVFVEGKPGPSGLPVGTSTFNHSPTDPAIRPDLQIQANRDLGNGSSDPCDNSFPRLGGVPGLPLPDYSLRREVSDALNDFACRFSVFNASQFPCTLDTSTNFAFVDPNSTLQFCALVSTALEFPPGDTVLTARLRDTGGNLGTPVQIIVRVTQGSGGSE